MCHKSRTGLEGFCFLEAMQVKIIYSYCHVSAYLDISRYTLSEFRKTSVQNYKNLLRSLSYSTISKWVVLKGEYLHGLLVF